MTITITSVLDVGGGGGWSPVTVVVTVMILSGKCEGSATIKVVNIVSSGEEERRARAGVAEDDTATGSKPVVTGTDDTAMVVSSPEVPEGEGVIVLVTLTVLMRLSPEDDDSEEEDLVTVTVSVPRWPGNEPKGGSVS